jgi:hypothetical protein
VGLWPLQEAYGGEDLSGHGNHIELHDITFPVDGTTPWESPAAHFKGISTSYGHIQHGQHLDVKSFSWMAKVNRNTDQLHPRLLEWKILQNTAYGFIKLYFGGLHSYINIPGCSYNLEYHPAFPLNTWATLAVTYDFPTNTLTLWQNGESLVSTRTPCGAAIGMSSELYIGRA